MAGGSDSKESICQFMRYGFKTWVRKIPWRREWLPIPVFLTRELHGQRSLAGYNPWDRKESDTTEWLTLSLWGFLSGSDGKESAHIVGDLGLIPGLGRSPEEGSGNSLQYSCLENSIGRRAWQASPLGCKESYTTEKLTHRHTWCFYKEELRPLKQGLGSPW